MTDIATGLYAHGAILAALYERNKTGKRYGTAHESIVPMQAFQTSDGYITIAAASNAQYTSLCKQLNVEELAVDERFKTNELRVKNRDILIELLKPYFRKRTTAELMKILDGGSCPFGPVNTIEQVFNDKHIKEIDLVHETKTSKGTRVRMVGPPVVYSVSQNAVRSPPPYLGQHTREILTQELKYPEPLIQKLYEEKVVQ
ncbi:succinyl-CoA:glutarate CoA-transferase-like isoform X2 [Rhodnius prolixus]|uniref:succinyl-CoA:glutarate CoA-transferase-like isoform X2 n=1 Tax=Rhodnius prolixus TaxID=13249 RepID=UPI003D188B58